MTNDAAASMTVPQPLGPGDTDPRSAAVTSAAAVVPPLGPGDAPEGHEPQVMPPVAPAPGPGDHIGPESEFDVRALPAFGPGEMAVPRPVIRLRKRVAPVAAREKE